jgi:hypothetical protein
MAKLWRHPALPVNVIVPIARARGVRLWGVGQFRGTVDRTHRCTWAWRAWDVIRPGPSEGGIEDTMREAEAKCLACLRRMAGLEEPC